MSKIDEASWVTLSITVTPNDFMELEDAISDLRWNSGTSSGFLEHIKEQYELKLEGSKPSSFAQKDFEFLRETVALGKTPEGHKIITTSSYFMKKILELTNMYGKEKVNRTIDLLKKHEKAHEHTQKNQA